MYTMEKTVVLPPLSDPRQVWSYNQINLVVFIEQDTSPLLLSTGWFQQQYAKAELLFHNLTETNSIIKLMMIKRNQNSEAELKSKVGTSKLCGPLKSKLIGTS